MTEEIQLINNNYNPAEAIEVIGNLIQHKMTFLSHKTLRDKEMFGFSDKHAEKRIEELSVLKQQLINSLKNLDPKTILQINGQISIAIIDQH